ncbi:class I SAM-dependent methyltransferase [Streptomyces sp. NBC_01476]|uniref:class I SAM-dependent methyltransferase n=1 Tax=Streptomyces sp. NBC_01476 TaxID=2903881 RepID=UPI002E354B03|nr:class I SAM-dependent methyltransferase [Streptomyces sp. NBC_01476]
MTVSLTVPETRAWSTADPYATALRAGHGPLFLHRADGWLLPLDVERWCAGPDDADRTVLAACRGATLDIGCGPGRMVTALAEGSRPALGIDVSTEAVRRTRAAGGAALLRSVFEPLPQEGHWRTALLIDGNIGIGGDPGALLSRVRQLVHSHGTLIVEAAPVGLADDLDERTPVRLHDGTGAHGAAFPWTRVGPTALIRHATAAGWAPATAWSRDDRRFVALRPHGDGRGLR